MTTAELDERWAQRNTLPFVVWNGKVQMSIAAPAPLRLHPCGPAWTSWCHATVKGRNSSRNAQTFVRHCTGRDLPKLAGRQRFDADGAAVKA